MRTVLVVDDEKDMRKKFKRLLVTKGFKVIEAPNALEVANILMREKSNLDLILLDIQIGELDGRDIFDIIDEYAPVLPVIVTSVLPLNDQKLKIPRAADYFHKGDKDEVFLSKVCRLLGVA